MENSEKRVLKFHTARGGRFFNQGHVYFVDFEKINEGGTLESLFIEDDGTYFDDSGNEIDCQINIDGTGYVDFDGEYDTYNAVFEDDLNIKQISALCEVVKKDMYNCKEAKEILKKYYPEYIDEEENNKQI